MGNRAKVVLLADNTPDFLDTRAEYLERAGYKVLRASSSAEARRLLETVWIHVAILDIRLEDDNDAYDDSGVRLAAEPAFRHIPKIMLTAFPHLEYVRQTLAARPFDRPPAVNFFDKQESPQKMLEAVAEAFSAHLRINWHLAMHRSSRCNWTLFNVASALNMAGDDQLLQGLVPELEDLLCRLFYQSHQITLDRWLWQKDNRVAFTVYSYTQGKPVRQCLVTCGVRPIMGQERDNIHRLGPGVSAPGIPTWVDYSETLHVGANCYELRNASLETARSFAHFFVTASSREVGTAVDYLAERCLAVWHHQPRIVTASPRMLSPVASDQRSQRESPRWLSARLADLGREMAEAGLGELIQSEGHLVLRFLRGQRHRFPDPVLWLEHQSPDAAKTSLLYSLTLNSLEVDTILVDADGQPWLTDFSAVAEGPVLSDYAAMESAFKYDLLDDSVSLEDIYELEEVLLSAQRLNERLTPPMNKVAKLVSAVQHVRQQASRICGPAIKPYLWELMFCAVDRLRTYTPKPAQPRPRRELLPPVHAALCVGLLCNRLSALSEVPLPGTLAEGGLSLDRERFGVHVQGRFVPLTPGEFKLMEYLWRHAGRVCTRRELAQLLYGEVKRSDDDSALNMVINRLREKIESDPARPKYLKTMRGQGYVLYPQGEN